MREMDRREFLKRGAAALAWLSLPVPFPLSRSSDSPPTSLGRIATWWRQAVRTAPAPDADWVAWKTRDEIIPLYAAVEGEPPWPSNPIWYETEEGYIHSGYIQPVEDDPQPSSLCQVGEAGFWAEVCVPIAEARWRPGSPYVARKLYYETVYRVVQAVEDEEGGWWYQLQEGITYSPGPYVPAQSLRRIRAGALLPISPDKGEKKRVEINLADQKLTCFEGNVAVFSAPLSSGVPGLVTPRGEYRVLYKRHTRRMIGADYDLPGVPFPVYFTWNGVAIHGTYWHNDYGRPHSHGCVNLTSRAARWVFRWTEPAVPYEEYTQQAESNEGTRVVVV